MKPIELIKFCEKNAKEIRSSKDAAFLMFNRYTCVLRPFSLPRQIEIQMTKAEIIQYTSKSDCFTTRKDIPKALEWVKNWVNKK